MKKFKLFALAVFAMLSTNAFAVDVPYEDANTIFRFTVTKAYVAGTPETLGEATIIGFVADYSAFATTEIPATVNGATHGGKFKVTGIGESAFSGKAITTLNLSAAENLTTIGANAFKGTSITTLDLSATKVAVLNQLFENTNTKVTTVKLPKTLTTIGANAFEGLSALNSITFAAQTAPAKYGLTINANAFKNTMALTTLTLPAEVSRINADAFANTWLTTLTFTGNIPAYAAAVNYEGYAEYNAAKGTELTADQYADLPAEEKIKTPATGIASGAFVRNPNGTQTLTVNYTPTVNNVNPFQTAESASTCFGANADAAKWVTIATTTTYGEWIETQITPAKFYGVKKVDYTPAALDKIKVYNQGSSFSYAAFYDPTNAITIEKKQGTANVMVYGAYVDNAETPAILMDQLHLIEGKYWIPAKTPIIVKSSATADVEYTKGADLDGNTSVKTVGGNPANEIKVYGVVAEGEHAGEYDDEAAAETYAVNVTPTAGKYTIFLKPLEEMAFGWAEFNPQRVIKKGQFYLEANVPADAMRLIWLDGSEEEATAIKTVKGAKAENGAIYNLAGQKVNAAYKGVVIKDGKKYIQK